MATLTAPSSVLVGLANVAHSIRYDELPREVVAHAKALIFDTIGCAYGGFENKVGQAVRTMVADAGGRPEATVFGSTIRTTAALATFANGTMLRYLDNNDYYFARDPAHPSGNLAVAFAVGERNKSSGKKIIEAMVAAYEIHLRLCDFAGDPTLWRRGWHHGTNAQFSSSALASLLLGLDPTATAHAMAIAGSHQNTLAQLQSGEMSMIKATAEAWVAKAGVEAALLASYGVTGPLSLMEGPAGWAKTVAGSVDVEGLISPVEGHYRLLDTCIKPYPAVATAIAPIQAAIELHRELAFTPAEIGRVAVRLPSFALGTPSAHPERRYPGTKESADHSFYYCVAIALLDGECGEEQFAPEKLTSAVVHDVLSKVVLEEDIEMTALWPASAGGSVTVHLRDGSTHERRCSYPPGHPRNALSDEALIAKFDENAGALLTRENIERIQRAVLTLDDCDDIGDLTRMLIGTD